MGWFWTLIHLDDFLLAVLVGIWSWVVHSERRAARHIFERLGLVDPPSWDGHSRGPRFVEGSASQRYVVFSDHHLLWRDARHDYVSHWGNRDIYARVLDRYDQERFTLVDNGDVEDLVLIKPGAWDNLGQLLLDSLPFSGLFYFLPLFSRRRRQRLQRILSNYAGHYQQVRRFWQDGRFIKLSGNHEAYLREEQYASILRDTLGPRTTPEGSQELSVHDYLVIRSDSPGQPATVVCHGHQFDPWTNPGVAKCVGEAFTRFKGWTGNGGDRIWLREWEDAYDTPWAPRLMGAAARGYDNVLAPGPWMRFTKPSKFLHLSERAMHAAMMCQAWSPDRPMPRLVIGHTHEVRLDPWLDEQSQERWEGYANSGSAGRFQDLIFCVEIEQGRPSLWAWYVEHPGGPLLKVRLVPDHAHRALVPEGT